MPNLRARFISSEPLVAGIYRPLCWLYVNSSYCTERASMRVAIKITYENCCFKAPFVCACGYYAEMKLCQKHADEFEGKDERIPR